MDFVIGDLVFHRAMVDYPHFNDERSKRRLGLVISSTHGHFHQKGYKIFWLGEKIVAEHLASELELVYNIDVNEKDD